MSTSNNTVPLISDQLLADYADGCLDSQTERRVEALIANDPSLRTKVLDLIALRQAIRADLTERAGKPEQPETIRLVKELDKAMRPPKRWRFGKISTGLAAAAAVLIVGTVYWPEYRQGMSGLQRAAVNSLLSPATKSDDPANKEQQATTASGKAAIEAQPVNATSGDTKQHKPDLVPDFSPFGFELVETRLVSGEAGDTVHLLYEKADGQRVSLYYGGAQNARNQQVTVRQEGALSLLFWYVDGRSFSMIGEIDKNRLVELARTVTAGLSLEDDQPATTKSNTAPENTQPAPKDDGTGAEPEQPDGATDTETQSNQQYQSAKASVNPV